MNDKDAVWYIGTGFEYRRVKMSGGGNSFLASVRGECVLCLSISHLLTKNDLAME